MGYKRNIIFLFTAAALVFSSGCNLLYLNSKEANEFRQHRAELDFKQYKKKKVMVLVKQQGWAKGQANLRLELTREINASLKKQFRFKDENLVQYNEIARLRSKMDSFESMSPYEIGKLFDSNVVIVVSIDDYALYELADAGYYSGFLVCRSSVFDLDNQIKAWPSKGEGSKRFELVVDVERTSTGVICRLSRSAAHCITRYFYNCDKDKFRVMEEKITPDSFDIWK